MSSTFERPEQAGCLEYFRLLVADDRQFILLEAAAAVAQDDDPELDPSTVPAAIEALGAALARRLPSDASAAQRLRLLNHYFYGELGFCGNVNDYYDVQNSHLHRVLQTRRGIPVTLAVLYTAIAAEVGLQMSGVSFPGHFLVKCSLPQGEVIIDPFTGRSLSRQELDERLLPYRQRQGLVGELEVPLGLYLHAATPRETLARLLRNLKEIHQSREDWPRLRGVMERLVLVVPSEASERRDLALVLAEMEQWGAAARELSTYLNQAPDAADAQAMAERLSELRRLARLH